MKFKVNRLWFKPLVIFVSIFCVIPFFKLAGFRSPLSDNDHVIAGIALYIFTCWGIIFFLGNILAYILVAISPHLEKKKQSQTL